MAIAGRKTVALYSIILLSACAGKAGDWPNLSDPLPDASERERVITRAAPTPYASTAGATRDEALSAEEAAKVIESVTADIGAAKTLYAQARHQIGTAEAQEKDTVWHEAQMLLTRLSYTADALDAVLMAGALRGANVWQKAEKLKAATDDFVVRERQALRGLKP